MLVLGLILIALSAGALVAVVAGGTDDQAALWGGSANLPTLVVFLLGAATLLVFIMGLELVRSGLKRANQNRRNSRRLRKLEKREETRQETPTPADGPVATDSAGEPPPAQEPAPPPAADGPYQSPPPAR